MTIIRSDMQQKSPSFRQRRPSLQCSMESKGPRILRGLRLHARQGESVQPKVRAGTRLRDGTPKRGALQPIRESFHPRRVR